MTIASASVINSADLDMKRWLADIKRKPRYSDISEEFCYRLGQLEAKKEIIVAMYGEDAYNKWVEETKDYYESMFSLQEVPQQTGSQSASDTLLENVTNPAPNKVAYNVSELENRGTLVFFDEKSAFMRKIPNAVLGIEGELEIRPYIRRLPNEIPFRLRMVDSNFRPCSILMGSGLCISGLRLCPNPETLAINSGKIINRYQTITRWVEDHWGDEIDVVNLSGSSFSFYCHERAGVLPGMVSANRSLTEAYQALRELSRFFLTDGFVIQDNHVYDGMVGSARIPELVSTAAEEFLTDPDNMRFINNHPREGMIKERLYINLEFDYLSLYGYLDTFDISEDATNPFKLSYTLVFKSEKTCYRQGSIVGG